MSRINMAEFARDAAGMPAAKPWSAGNATPALVRDLSPAEAQAEDAGIVREDMTDAERCEKLANHVHDMLERDRALRDENARLDRALRDALVAQSPVQAVASFEFADFATRGPEILATIRAVQAMGYEPGICWLKQSGACAGITIGVRVAA